METYPASLLIDYSDQSDRLTVLFRWILVIPIFIILALLISGHFQCESESKEIERISFVGIVFFPTLLMILFRRKYPKWWFDWNISLTKFSHRVGAYIMLLRDEYPSTDDEQAVHIDIPYPDVEKDLNRWMPLVKWFLAIPHFIILSFLWIATGFCTCLAWFIILFTGRYPKSLFEFVVGVLRWSLRVCTYAFLLTTDEYPPFSLEE